MTHKDEFPIDRAQEDRTVEYLRANGVFGGRADVAATAHVAANDPDVAPTRNPSKWRVPVIAAAAAVLLAFISVLVDRTSQPADEPPAQTPTPRLLVWY